MIDIVSFPLKDSWTPLPPHFDESGMASKKSCKTWELVPTGEGVGSNPNFKFFQSLDIRKGGGGAMSFPKSQILKTTVFPHIVIFLIMFMCNSFNVPLNSLL